MATLNLSANGPSITKSYQAIINSAPASGLASKSATYAHWAVFSVSAPLTSAFQQDTGSKESVLKVQSTGEGELIDLIDEFSDGRIQFAFAKVNDPNTTLHKYALIAWCGEGVPERTKGYFTSHLAAVSRVLHGYHVQITARSDRDLSPEGILQKIADASGSKYSSGSAPAGAIGLPPPVSSKPVYTPTHSSGAIGGFNPLGGSRLRSAAPKETSIDEDGWGQDAPQVTRTQLEKVPSAYQPTKVDFQELRSQQSDSSQYNSVSTSEKRGNSDIVKGEYKPVGKVDIAALRREAQESGKTFDDRPTVVKGSYEPVGKVDIAAIKARAQKPTAEQDNASTPKAVGPRPSTTDKKSLHDNSLPPPHRSAPFSTSERLTSLPKPRISNRFGGGAGSFAGTKAPTPRGLDVTPSKGAQTAPLGVGRTFADQGGKTPAQLWAEKKARERGISQESENKLQPGDNVKNGYEVKTNEAEETNISGRPRNISDRRDGDETARDDASAPPVSGVDSLRNRFKDIKPMGASNVGIDSSLPSPPPLDTSNKPNAVRGIPIPGLPTQITQGTQQEVADDEYQEAPKLPTPPPQPPRSPTPPTPVGIDSGSPIHIAMPVGRSHVPEIEDARKEQISPPPAMPTRSLAQAIPHENDLADEPLGHDPARATAEATAALSLGNRTVGPEQGTHEGGRRALVQYDYDKAEDNELNLKEGEYVTNIDMVDNDWWMGQNMHGETGLFPSNYVELVEDENHRELEVQVGEEEPSQRLEATKSNHGHTATALYDYEAAEDNELSFPDDAKITNVEFPDQDWWSGEYGGRSGLFPANYVRLDE